MKSQFNQTLKKAAGKPRLSVVPSDIIFAIARTMEYGARKYGDPQSWKQVEPERFRDAAYRHFLSYINEPDGADAESGLPHLYHLACNIAFLIALRRKQEILRIIQPNTN